MAKSSTAIVLIIIIVVIAGAVGAYYYLGTLTTKPGKSNGGGGGSDNILPIAYFTGNYTGRVGEKMWFDANGSSDKDGFIELYEWRFGDGGNPVQYNSSLSNHTYYQAGIYSVNLTVIDDAKGKDSYSEDITIIPNNYMEERVDILIQRFGIVDHNETIPVEEFAESLSINITVTGASMTGGPIPEDAVVEITVSNPIGIIIGNETLETRGQVTTDFYFSKIDLIFKGDYELVATCLQGALYLNYVIEVSYS
jgi:PKD repeat protein